MRTAALVALGVLLCAPARAADHAAARASYDRACDLYRAGQFRDALRQLNDAISSDSRLAGAYALRARVWDVLGEPSRRRDDAERAVSLIGGGKLGPDQLLSQCAAYLALGQADKGLASCDAAVAASNQSPEALAGRARAWIALGELKKAVADLDAALKSDPKVPLWLYARARARYELGDDKGAIGDLTSALRANKSFAISFGLLGAALARSGDLARALKAYDRAAALDPEYEFAYLGRAAVRLRQGDEAGAMKDFEAAVRADAQDYAPYFNRAEVHWRAGRRPEALADYRNALSAPKLAPEAASAIGDRYMSLQLWRDAIDAYTRAFALGGGTAALERRARAWEILKEPKKALGDLDQAVKLKPDDAALVAARGALESRLGMDKPALEDLTRAVRLAPKDAGILVLRASFYARVGRPQLALQDYDAALDADPNDAEAYNGRGALRANALNDLEKAMVDVTRAVALGPKEPAFHFNLGMLRLKGRLFQKAIDSFDTSLALGAPAARVLQQRAEAKFQLGDHVGAKQDIESAIEKDPRNASIYDTLGFMRVRARAYEQAVRDLSQALRLDDKMAPAYLHRGLAYGGLNQFKPALADFKRAAELDPGSKEVWTDLCQVRRLMREPKDGLDDCARAIALDSQYGPAYFQRGLNQLSLRQYARAIEDLDAAWQLGTRRPEGLIAEAIAHAASRQYKEAHLAYLKALDLDPYVRSAYVGFSAGHPEGDDFLSAISELDSAMQEDQPHDPYVFILRADSLHSGEQFDKAVLEYTKAMEVDGTIADAYIGRGVALTAQDALEASQNDLVRAIELAPDDADARVRLAITLTMRRNYSAALAELVKALKIDPKSADAHLRAGNVYYFQKNWAKALENYSLAVKDDPLDPNALNGMGLGYYATKRYDDALEMFSRAISMNPLADRFYRNRASVWTAEQKYGNAAGDFRTASMVNTDPSLVEEYRKLIDEAEARAAIKSS